MMTTRRQIILQYLFDQASYGYDDVKWACRQFFKQYRTVGVKKEERKDVPKAWTLWALEQQGGKCHRCGRELKPEDATGDHLIPVNLGGPHVRENIYTMCGPCNSSKGDNNPMEESKVTARTILEQLKR